MGGDASWGVFISLPRPTPGLGAGREYTFITLEERNLRFIEDRRMRLKMPSYTDHVSMTNRTESVFLSALFASTLLCLYCRKTTLGNATGSPPR